jgi:hypothetical protein
MAKRITRRTRLAKRPRRSTNGNQQLSRLRPKSKRRVRRGRPRLAISDTRLERGLRVLHETKNIKAAARSIRVSEARFKLAAKRKAAIRKGKGVWTVVRRLPRKMPIFSDGRQLTTVVNSKTASVIARYMSAVGKFLKSNDPKSLAEFKGVSVKDASGKVHPFETDPNTLYRLSSAGGEPFEEMYRIVI